MFLPTFITFSSVLLASGASAPSSDSIDGAGPTTTVFKSFSFSVAPTINAGKESSDNRTLQNDANMQYLGKVNVGGRDFDLQVDTGSSDLYVIRPQQLTLNSTTNTTVNLTFGRGSAYGNIAFAPVLFGGYRVDNQAFVNVTKTVDESAGDQGLIGIGLNGLNALERKTKNASARSVMANMFAQHPSLPRFFGLTLERSEDGEHTAGGCISIGEYDPQFSNVTSTPKNPVTPASGSRWTIAMEGLTINGRSFPLRSRVKGTPKGKAISLIDSGTSLALMPSDAVDALYAQFNGSVHVETGSEDLWYVPCLEQANVSFTFGDVAYPMNPMELSSPARITHRNGQYTVCTGTFRPIVPGFEHQVDYLLGDVFMRNVYSVFHFGNQSTSEGDAHADAAGASIQLLSRTNRDETYADFARQRQKSLEAYPPLFDLTKLHPDGSIDGGGSIEST